MRSAACLLLLALLAVNSVSGRELSEAAGTVGVAVLNGRDAPRSRYPYFGQLRPWNVTGMPARLGHKRGEFIGCGATLIARDMALTSANCAWRANYFAEVRLNAWKTQGGRYQSRKVVAVAAQTIGTKFDHYALAILQLDRPSTFAPARLPPATSAGKPGDRFGVLGWGSTTPKYTYPPKLAPNLKQATQQLLPRETCAKKWPFALGEWTDDAFICSAFPGHAKALCWGEDASPLLKLGRSSDKDVLVGVSEENQCTASGNESGALYMNVAFNKKWIQDGMAMLRGKLPETDAYSIMRAV